MLILSFMKLLSQTGSELFTQKHLKTIILFVVFILCHGSIARPLAISLPCRQSSRASAFKNLLVAFKLTVTSNRAVAVSLGQFRSKAVTIKQKLSSSPYEKYD